MGATKQLLLFLLQYYVLQQIQSITDQNGNQQMILQLLYYPFRDSCLQGFPFSFVFFQIYLPNYSILRHHEVQQMILDFQGFF